MWTHCIPKSGPSLVHYCSHVDWSVSTLTTRLTKTIVSKHRVERRSLAKQAVFSYSWQRLDTLSSQVCLSPSCSHQDLVLKTSYSIERPQQDLVTIDGSISRCFVLEVQPLITPHNYILVRHKNHDLKVNSVSSLPLQARTTPSSLPVHLGPPDPSLPARG